MEIKSHFTFNSKQRSGILLLLLVIMCLLCVYWWVDFSEEDTFDIESAEIVAVQKEIDSIYEARINQKSKIYPFNPNYITDHKGYSLGMSNEEIDRLLSYREREKWVNSAAEFQAVTGISDSLLAEISPYFQFPDWVSRKKQEKTFRIDNKGFVAKSYSEKVDLNEATEEQLQQVSGIGPAFSKRIVSFRERLGGFSHDDQLYSVYGLEDEVVKRTLNLFTVKTPTGIKKININTASASDIATIPGISYELAKKIWEYRRLRERLNSLEELAQIEEITQGKLKLIQLYLSVD